MNMRYYSRVCQIWNPFIFNEKKNLEWVSLQNIVIWKQWVERRGWRAQKNWNDWKYSSFFLQEWPLLPLQHQNVLLNKKLGIFCWDMFNLKLIPNSNYQVSGELEPEDEEQSNSNQIQYITILTEDHNFQINCPFMRLLYQSGSNLNC